MNINFLTPKSVEECKELLLAALRRQGAGERSVSGQVHRTGRFEICVPMPVPGLTNCLKGQLEPQESGTRIKARFDSSVWALAFAAFAALFMAMALLSLLLTGDTTFDQRPGITLFVLFVGGLLILTQANRKNRRDRLYLLDFVGKNLVPDYVLQASESKWSAKRVAVGMYIQASAGQIWAALTDPASFPDWIDSMQSVEVLTTGEYGVGTKYKATAGTGQRTVNWTVEVTGVEPERHIDFKYYGYVEGKGGWSIEPLDEGFYVTSFDEFEASGSIKDKLINRFVMDSAARAAREQSLRQLKALLEDQS